MKKHIFISVTNDISYDQRMQKTANSLLKFGYDVTIIGRYRENSIPTLNFSFKTHRFRLFFQRGKLFYVEYNIRLLIYLIFHNCNILCAVDLDTIIPNVIASKIKNLPLIYDAHEFFTEVPELTNRRLEKAIWDGVEKLCVPLCDKMYTVGDGISELFRAKYNRDCEVIYNYPNKKPIITSTDSKKHIIIYQGDLNEGRGLSEVIEAMKGILDAELWILGDGYERQHLEELSRRYSVSDRVKFLGYILPADIDLYTRQAYLGLNLFENKGLNYYYSLANKFFDYIQNRVPVLSMNFPEYRRINDQYNIAILIDNIDVMTIQAAIKAILNDKMKYDELVKNCDIALRFLNWEVQEEKLRSIYYDVE